MKSNKGSALVTVILTFTVLSILALTLITVITARMHLTVSYADSTGALYAAQAGLEKVKLDIRNQISSPTFKTDVERYVQGYLDKNPGATDNKLSAISNDATEQYLFYKYLASPTYSSQLNSWNMLTQGTAKYEILPFSNTSDQPGNSYYDKANNRVIIRSKGTYGKKGITKTVALTLQLSSSPDNNFNDTVTGGAIKWQDIPNYSILVSNPASSEYSFKGYCQSLTVNGDFYIPKGMESILNVSTIFTTDFNGKLTVYGGLTLGSHAQQITVRDGMSVNGDLILGASSMRLIVENGDLVVNGNIIIYDYNNQINVLNGNLRCNGNIIFDKTKNCTSSHISIAKNLYMMGTIMGTDSGNNSVDLTGSSSVKYTNSYGGTINPAPINTLNTSVFSASNIIKTNSINTNTDYGSINNPVIIYSDGDLNINLPYNTSYHALNIYGLVYAKGKINITSTDEQPAFFNMYGPMISEKEVVVNDYRMTAKFEYDGQNIMANLIKRYQEVISSVYSGFLTASPTTRNVYVTTGFISKKWEE